MKKYMKLLLFSFIIIIFASCGSDDRDMLVGHYTGNVGKNSIILNICEYEKGKLGVELKDGDDDMFPVFARMSIVVEAGDSIVTFERRRGNKFDDILAKQKIFFLPGDVTSLLSFEKSKCLFTKIHDYPKELDNEYNAMKAAMIVIFDE